jgi:DNA-binding transcriptional regulator YhcF (GntR family)
VLPYNVNNLKNPKGCDLLRTSFLMGNNQKIKIQSNQVDISAEEIADTLVSLLLTGQVRAGMRLRSMHDLTQTFRTDYRRVYNAIEALSKRGILVKRKGSGTFVRCLPIATEAVKPSPLFRKLKIEQILFIQDALHTRRRPLLGQRHLKFQFWADLHWNCPISTAVIQGAEDILSPLGHQITRCSATDASGAHIDKGELAKMLRTQPADGYLTMDWVAESYGEQFAATGKLWLTCGYSGPIRHQPAMILDCMEAVERGTQVMIEGGCRRVALLGWLNADRSWECEFERFYYSHALRRAGIEDYNVAIYVQFDAVQVRRAMAEMLDSKLPPDGLYLADDNLLPYVAQELERRGIVPGRDLCVVTLWNDDLSGKTVLHEQTDGGLTILRHEEQSFVSPYQWSRMEQSPRQFGRALSRNLISATHSTNARLANYAILANWKPGKTHLRTSKT